MSLDDAGVDAGEELAREARLSDAGGAEQREEGTRASANGVRERVFEHVPLVLAADHRGIEMPGDAGSVGRHRVEAIRDERRLLSLQLERDELLDVDGVAGERSGLGAEEDLTRSGRLLEAGGDVDGVARREAFLRAGDDFARVDADAKLERRAVVVRELLVQGLHRDA